MRTDFTPASAPVILAVMIRHAALTSALLLAACSGSDEPTKQRAPTTEEALKTASTPFSIGDNLSADMGNAPVGELDDGINDPYDRMARDANVSAPAEAEMGR